MSKHSKKEIAHKVLFVSGNVLVVFLAVLSALICSSILWVFKTWPNLTMQELMFTIQSPFDGTNKEMIVDYIISCIPVTIAIFLFVSLILFLFRKKKVYIISVIIILAAYIYGMGTSGYW